MVFDAPTFSLSVDITHNCNLRCRHCFNYSGERYVKPELTDEQILSIPNQLKYLPIEAVCLCGGEPLLRKDVTFSMISKLRDAGIPSVNLTTNGLLLTSQIAEQLKNLGIGNIQVSIDGLKDAHNWLRNSDDAFDGAMTAIKTLVDCGVDVGVACTPSKRNLNDVIELMDLLDSIGTSMFRMQPIMSLGRARCIEDYYLTTSDYAKLSMTLTKVVTTKKYKMVVEWGDPTQHLFYLSSGKEPKLISINAYGDILLSLYVPISFGNISRHPFNQYIEHGLRSVFKTNNGLKHIFEQIGSAITSKNDTVGIPELYKDDMLDFDIIEYDLDKNVSDLMKKLEASE